MNNTRQQMQSLLTALSDGGGKWMSRRQIAQTLGKNKLNAREVALLDVLALKGNIEAREVKNDTPIGYSFEYRSKEDKTE